MADDSGDYEVGFGKPPVWGRFRSGRSGNPAGRPPGRKSGAALFHEACNGKVKVKGADGYQCVTKFEAAVTQLLNKAASGDLKAIKEVFRLQQMMPDLEVLKAPTIHVHFVTPDGNGRRLPLVEDGKPQSSDKETI